MNTFTADQNVQNQIDSELYAILPVVEQVRLLHAKSRYGFDICPQNIVMTRHGALLRVKNITLNASGASIYRPGYTPRERYMGGILGPWTDVYAVSALVYTAMTGLMLPSAFERGHSEPLFGGLDEKYRALEDIVTQGLAPDVAQRLKSLDALSTQMHACLAGYMPPSEKRQEKPRRPIKPVQTTAAASIAVLLLLSGAMVVNEVNYAQAVAHADAGDYALSQKSLKGVFAFYKDAAQLFDYADAGAKLESGSYGAAAQSFSALGGYRNSEDMVRETDYRHAQALMQQGSLAEAEELLNALGNYKDSFQLLKQISYQNGVIYLDADMYLSAIEAFGDASGYADAAQRAEEVKEMLYIVAQGMLGAGDADRAAQYLAAIPGYKKADELAGFAAVLALVQRGEAVAYGDYSFFASYLDTFDMTYYMTADPLIAYYLRGRWQDEAGNSFVMDDSGVRYNISGAEGSGNEFHNGELHNGENRVLLFTCIDINTVQVYTHGDGATYVMQRG